MSAVLPPVTHRAGLAGALRSEWTKLWSVRSTGYCLAGVATVAIGVTFFIAWANMSRWNELDAAERAEFASNPLDPILAYPVLISQIVVAVLGVLIVCAEYSTGTLRPTLQAQPRRLVVLAAKVLMWTALMLGVGPASAFAGFLVGRPVLGERAPIQLGDPGVLRAVIGAGLYLTVLGLFAMAIGVILRSTAGAVATVLGILVVVSNLTSLLPGAWGRYVDAWMPVNAGRLVLQQHPLPGDLFGPLQGLAVFAGWTALLLVVAAVLFRRRDA